MAEKHKRKNGKSVFFVAAHAVALHPLELFTHQIGQRLRICPTDAVQVITQMQQITVRASSDDISKITASNVHAVADLSGISANAGTYTVPLTIEIYGYPNAGVIGSYNAVVSLEEPSVNEPQTGEDE